jgi:hypothetical protein
MDTFILTERGRPNFLRQQWMWNPSSTSEVADLLQPPEGITAIDTIDSSLA